MCQREETLRLNLLRTTGSGPLPSAHSQRTPVWIGIRFNPLITTIHHHGSESAFFVFKKRIAKDALQAMCNSRTFPAVFVALHFVFRAVVFNQRCHSMLVCHGGLGEDRLGSRDIGRSELPADSMGCFVHGEKTEPCAWTILAPSRCAMRKKALKIACFQNQ